MLLHVRASAEPGLSTQWASSRESRERIPKSWGSSSKFIPSPSAASFSSDACDGLCACVASCLLLVNDGDQHAMHQLMPLAATRQPHLKSVTKTAPGLAFRASNSSSGAISALQNGYLRRREQR